MDAQRALDSLLGRTTIHANEVQLLGAIHSDVEFIKDEMESMNGLLLHLTEAQFRDEQVKAWMKQVVGLTRDCEGNVELYIRYGGARPSGDRDGFIGYHCWAVRFLLTVPVHRRIASRIQALKVRAREVSDRRQRYGVTVPPSATASNIIDDGDIEIGDKEEDLRRRTVLLLGAEPLSDDEQVVKEGMDTLIKCLSRDQPPAEPQACVVQYLYDDSRTVLYKIIEEITGDQDQPGEENEDKEQLVRKLQEHLNGKHFLIVFITHSHGEEECRRIIDALLHAADGCHPGSAILLVTDRDHVAVSSRPSKIIHARSLLEFYTQKANKMGADYTGWIFHRLCTNAFAMKAFLHLLYVVPHRTEDERRKYADAFSECRRLNRSVSKQVLMLCYNELPRMYRGCLLYLTIFPDGHVIRTTSLARRWLAEGLIRTSTSTGKQSAMDDAEHYLDVLFIRGFVSPVEISGAGNIKSCTIHHEVREFIAKIARDVNFVDPDQPTYLAHHFSIHNKTGLQESHSDSDRKGIVASLPSLAASPQWKLLKVLDLEGCHGLEKHHLKSICRILLLKYLSLRNSDVTKLPKQIKKLQCLETLDVRQTKVQVFSKKVTVLPLLKHFLAGHKVSGSNGSTLSEDPVSEVQVPLCIEKMNNMEILSHVRVSNSKELAGITQLLKLRKLGVALHGKHAKLCDLFCHIKKLHRCLRSLSICIDPQGGSEIQDVGMVDPLPSIPQFIESLNISGITGGLRHLIQEHHKLTKITLYETHLEGDDLAILGSLGALRCLRLQHNSYTTGYDIVFRGEEFQSLNYLLVEVKGITKIRFCPGAAPNLDGIVWSFARMDALSGLNHLTKLKNVELNGDCDLHPIEEELFWHPNDPTLKHKPHQQHQEDRSAAPSSTSSDP